MRADVAGTVEILAGVMGARQAVYKVEDTLV